MTPDERDRFMFRLTAIWPSPPIADGTLLIWHELIGDMDPDRAIKALNALQKTSGRRPAQSDFWEAYQAQPGPARVLNHAPDCGVCGGTGFVDVACEKEHDCKRGFGHTVTRCPNGCQPPTAEENTERGRRDDERWRRETAAKRGMERRAVATLDEIDRTMSRRAQEIDEPF